jgi:hypothetical protein
MAGDVQRGIEVTCVFEKKEENKAKKEGGDKVKVMCCLIEGKWKSAKSEARLGRGCDRIERERERER